MTRKKTSRVRPRSLGRKLTPKQAAFIHHYSNPKSDAYGNATRACERAGYAGDPGSNQLAVQGWRNLCQPEIQVAVRTALSEQGFTPEFAAKTLMGAMRATVVRARTERASRYRTNSPTTEPGCRALTEPGTCSEGTNQVSKS